MRLSICFSGFPPGEVRSTILALQFALSSLRSGPEACFHAPLRREHACRGELSTTRLGSLRLLRQSVTFGIRLEDLRDGVDPTLGLGAPARLSSSQTYFSFMTSAPVSESGIHALMALGLVMIGWVGRRKNPEAT